MKSTTLLALSLWMLAFLPSCAEEKCSAGDTGCAGSVCGDGLASDDEACDGTDLAGRTCADFNYNSGELSCDAYCRFNFINCAGESPECGAAEADLTQEMYSEAGRACSAVVRLDYATYELLGFQLFCGGYGGMDEAGARAAAGRDTGLSPEAVLVNPDDHGDLWVFVADGEVALVSGTTGLTVFGGTWGTGEPGDLTYPAAWRDAALLAQACPPSGGVPDSRGFDLTDGASQLTYGETDPVLAVIADTALLAGFWHGGYVFDATVLLYPRTVDPVDPGTAEWIVVIGGGWLE